MNWEAISAVSEIVGAVAVVISLIYVAAQIRQNTKMMRATAKQSLTDASQSLIYTAIDKSEEWVKLTTGDDASTREEDARMSLLVRAMLRGFETQCYQYESGLLEDDEWRALRAAIKDLCSLPGFNKYWQQLKPHMSERLKKVVDG
jgi:hypothetical protein